MYCACLLSALCLIGCDGSADEDTDSQGGLSIQMKAVESHLNDMLQRESGAFLVVSLPGNTLLIQFSGSSNEDVVADLPLKWVDDVELKKAREIFLASGATNDQLPGRAATDLFPSLQVAFGRDTEKAAKFTAELLEQVYGVQPEDELVFETELD
jgi:hypothetical protein